jgi:hypothetical protein
MGGHGRDRRQPGLGGGRPIFRFTLGTIHLRSLSFAWRRRRESIVPTRSLSGSPGIRGEHGGLRELPTRRILVENLKLAVIETRARHQLLSRWPHTRADTMNNFNPIRWFLG